MIPVLWHIVVKAADGKPEGGLLLIGQPREGGCSTARLPKGKKDTYSDLKLSGFEYNGINVLFLSF